jgi:hypothetical protein
VVLVKESLLELPVRSRVRADAAEAYSGAWIERVELADGRALILKHLPATGDWLTRATGGLDRTRQLWERGVFGRLDREVEHGMLEVTSSAGHDVVVMRDLSDRLWPAISPLDRSAVGDALGGLGRLHQLGERLVADGCVGDLQLCSVGARYAMFAPEVLARDDGPNPHPARDRILSGWDVFTETVAADVVAAVDAVHRDPDRLGRRIAAAGDQSPTILHGDAKPENLGVTAGRLTAIDWGELTGVGPREVDVAWFTVMSTRSRLDADPSDVFTLYEQASGAPLNRPVLDLACIGSLAQMGFFLAAVARHAGRPEARHTAATRLAWWVDRVQATLDRVGAL